MLDDILVPHFTTLSLDLIACKCTRIVHCSLAAWIHTFLRGFLVSGFARTSRMIPVVDTWYFINIYLC